MSSRRDEVVKLKKAASSYAEIGRRLGMAQKKESKYQRCDECHGGYLIVFECKDKKKRCARCKETYDGNEGGMREEIVERAGVRYANHVRT